MKRLGRIYFCAMYYTSWFWFGAVGLGLNVCCALLLPLPRTEALQRRTRSAIRILFDLWARWFHASRVVQVRWIGFPAQLPRGAVYIANHPTLIDATLLLARMPDAFCIFKPALMRNPCIAPAALLGGYVAGDRHAETLREAATKVAAGQSLLVFPEGTRTAPGTNLGPFRPGFALVAGRAHAPIQLVIIRSSPGLVTRGRCWWAPPTVLPARMELELERTWQPDSGRSPIELAAEIREYLNERLPVPVS